MGRPDELARLGFAVAHALDPTAPPVPGLSNATQALADVIAEKLKAAERPLVISGMGCGDKAVVEAAANVAWALCNTGNAAELCYAVPECNSLGAVMLGGGSLESALEAMEMARRIRSSFWKTIFTGERMPPGRSASRRCAARRGDRSYRACNQREGRRGAAGRNLCRGGWHAGE